MVVSPSDRRPSRTTAAPDGGVRGWFSTQGWTWRQWLGLGLCFGLGHGITDRLLKLRADQGPIGAQNFGVQAFPGQSLEALRQRHGGPVLPLRADLDAMEQDKRMAKQKAEAEERRRDLEAQLNADQQQTRDPAQQTPPSDRTDSTREAASPVVPLLPAPQPPPAASVPEPAAGPVLPPLPQAPPAPSPTAQP